MSSARKGTATNTKHDRSLGFVLDPEAANGIRISSLAGDDPETCRAYVRSLLKKLTWSHPANVPGEIESRYQDDRRIIQARTLWDEGTQPRGPLLKRTSYPENVCSYRSQAHFDFTLNVHQESAPSKPSMNVA